MSYIIWCQLLILLYVLRTTLHVAGNWTIIIHLVHVLLVDVLFNTHIIVWSFMPSLKM